jgi:hypothetical protein
MAQGHHFSHLQVRNPKDDETPIESATQIFASLLPYPYIPWYKRWSKKPHYYAFEIYLLNQTVYLYATVNEHDETLVSSVISSSFPKCAIIKTEDPMQGVLSAKHLSYGQLELNSFYYLPIKTYADFQDIDSLSAVLGFLGKQQPEVRMMVQILITPANFPWQKNAVKQASHMVVDTNQTSHDAEGHIIQKYTQNPQKLLMMQKASFQGGKALIRLMVGTDTIDPTPLISSLAGTFGIFSLGEGNQLVFHKPRFSRGKRILLERIKERRTTYFEHQHQVLNAQELATIWHPTGILLEGVRNVAWGRTLKGEPPEDLPVAPYVPVNQEGVPDEAALVKAEALKKDVNFFATTDFKNQETIFGIKTADRRKHNYILGKTGAGKSTLIANMAIDDIRKDRGIGIIDPHGDLCDTILEFVPKRRINDVVYLEPFDLTHTFALNVLEVHNKEQKDLVSSGIVAIFKKIYSESWGPRLEYILRNIIITLLEVEGTTLVDILRIIGDAGYRKRIVERIQDPVIRSFWDNEFARMPDSMKAEAVSPIQNKVGQFVSAKMIRNIVGHPKSSINFSEIMDQGKILILNLSQGKLGEDNAALLGAMIITQIQLAAMNRSFMKEEDRRDFFLYIDEFQNFSTSSFIKILSEARKYRLCLTLANQYMGQLDEEVTKAIFGNVGTIISFVLGGQDAYLMSKEFAEIYTENELVSLGRHEIITKLSIDGMTSMPFPAKTLPLPSQKNENREKIIQLSKERYARRVAPVASAQTSAEPTAPAPEKSTE